MLVVNTNLAPLLSFMPLSLSIAQLFLPRPSHFEIPYRAPLSHAPPAYATNVPANSHPIPINVIFPRHRVNSRHRRQKQDRDAKFRLILTESRIHRLARYYKTKRVLPPTWKYESSTASALVA